MLINVGGTSALRLPEEQALKDLHTRENEIMTTQFNLEYISVVLQTNHTEF